MESERKAKAAAEAAAKSADPQVLEDAERLIAAWNERQAKRGAPFAELVRLSKISIADEMREEHTRRVLGE
jgi:hypothetical protein